MFRRDFLFLGLVFHHANSYVFPAKRTKAGWVEVPRWVEGEDLLIFRRRWAQELKVQLGDDAPGLVGLEEADVWINYLSGPAQVHHWMRYLYRSPLYDLWKGWQSGSVADGVNYQVWKDGKLRNLHLSTEDVGCAMQRVASVPKKWKRVRWFGCFSDGLRRSTMESLGLVGDEVDRETEAANSGLNSRAILRTSSIVVAVANCSSGTCSNTPDISSSASRTPTLDKSSLGGSPNSVLTVLTPAAAVSTRSRTTRSCFPSAIRVPRPSIWV